MPTPPGWPSWMKIVGPPVCGCAFVERPPMSQRSHIASSGSTAICACSVACSEPSSCSGGKPARIPASSSNHSACVAKRVGGNSSATRSISWWSPMRRALVGEDGLRDEHATERQRHAERLAPVEQALDQCVRLALGLGVPVAVERLDERLARLEVELAHVIGPRRGAGRRRPRAASRTRAPPLPCPSTSPVVTSTIAKESGEAERSDDLAAG